MLKFVLETHQDVKVQRRPEPALKTSPLAFRDWERFVIDPTPRGRVDAHATHDVLRASNPGFELDAQNPVQIGTPSYSRHRPPIRPYFDMPDTLRICPHNLQRLVGQLDSGRRIAARRLAGRIVSLPALVDQVLGPKVAASIKDQELCVEFAHSFL